MGRAIRYVPYPVVGGFLGFTLVTPQIIEHFLLVYGALLIVFLVVWLISELRVTFGCM